jgi:hypothetical protein
MYPIITAYGKQNKKLYEMDCSMAPDIDTADVIESIVEGVASNQHFAPNSLRGMDDYECMRQIGVVKIVARRYRERDGTRVKGDKDQILIQISPDEVIDHGPVMIREGQRVSLEGLKELLFTFDDFLLSFCPDPETGQPNVTEHDSGVLTGVGDAAAYDDLFRNTCTLFSMIEDEVNRVVGQTLLGDGTLYEKSTLFEQYPNTQAYIDGLKQIRTIGERGERSA